MTETEVRCPTCRKLLAVRNSSGACEVLHGGHDPVVVRDGELACRRCSVVVAVRVRDVLSVDVTLLSGRNGL